MDTSKSKKSTIPDTWAKLAAQWGVDPSILTRAVRVNFQLRGVKLPGHAPPPKIAGEEFIEQVKNAIFHSRQPMNRPQESERVSRALLQKRIRECLDKHQRLLGENLCETVADELDVPLSDVRSVMKESWEALKMERKIRAEMQAEEAAEQARKDRIESIRAQQSQLAQMPAKLKPTPVPSRAPAPLEIPEEHPRRPAAFPEKGTNIALDETLRAAWIARAAGLDVLKQTLVALTDDVPGLTEADVEAGIEAAYWERPEAARKAMEKRAERMRKPEPT